jgi:hypothetical protein
MFLAKLDERLEYFSFPGRFSDLFQGFCRTTTTSTEGEITVQEESFRCFGITFSGRSNLLQCLRQCISEEIVENVGTHRVIFSALPKVLIFHLRRFSTSGQKINELLEYPLYLDMSPFVCNGGNHFYELHGVIVHRGDANSGHYFALVKPNESGVWRKCDSERCCLITDENKLIRSTFGRGSIRRTKTSPLSLSKLIPGSGDCECAYLLMYFRRDAMEEVLKEPVVYPKDAEVWRNQICKKPAVVQTKEFLKVSVYTAESLRETAGARSLADCKPKCLEVKRESTQHELYLTIGKELDLDVNRIRLWRLKSSRVPDVFFHDCNSSLNLSEAQGSFFLLMIPDGESHFDYVDSILTFVMEFIPDDPPHWNFLKAQQLNRKIPIAEFIPFFQEILETTDNIEISIQNELGNVIPVQIGKSLNDHKVGTGPVFFIQRITESATKIDFSLRPIHNEEFAQSYAGLSGCQRPFSAAIYFEMEFCAVTFLFCQLNTEKVFVLRLPYGLQYNHLREILVRLTGASPNALVQVFRAARLWAPSLEIWPPDEQETFTVRDLIAFPTSPIACFAVFPKECKLGHFPVRVLWSDDGVTVCGLRQLQILKGSTVAKLIEEVGGDLKGCRVLRTFNGKILSIIENETVLIDEKVELRIENVPIEDVE